MIKYTRQVMCVLFLFSFIFIEFARANVEDVFSDFFYDNQISSLNCRKNISLFVQKLVDLGYSIDEVKILYITANSHRWSFGRVVAVNSRWGTIRNGAKHQNWDFHVIAVIDRKVYDISFNDTPLVLNFEDYLEKMFIPSSPFLINGGSFRVGNDGPLYTDDHARDELEKYNVDIMQLDSDGRFTTVLENQRLIDF